MVFRNNEDDTTKKVQIKKLALKIENIKRPSIWICSCAPASMSDLDDNVALLDK
jgi:hypothetical protein